MKEIEEAPLAARPRGFAWISTNRPELRMVVGLFVAHQMGCAGSGSEARSLDAGKSGEGAEFADATMGSSSVEADAAPDEPDARSAGRAGEDEGREEGDAASEAGAPDAPPATPKIVRLLPAAPFAGDQVTIEGTDLWSDSERVGVWVGGVPASILESGQTWLVVTLPKGLELRACDSDVDVVVAVGARQSDAVALSVKRPAPVVEDSPVTCPAGSELTLGGNGLIGSVVRVGALELTPTWASDSELRAILPREVAQGPTVITVDNECGSTTLDLEVLFPIPRVTSIDPPTLAPGGVAYVRADFADSAMLRGVRINGRRIAADDSTSFAWPSYAEPSSEDLFAVRMPLDLPVGPLTLTLETTSGESAPATIDGVQDLGQHPPVDDQIRIPPGAAVSDGDGRFPIGTSESDPVLGSDGARWRYTLLTGYGEGCREGRFYGHELLIPAHKNCWDYVYRACRPFYAPDSPEFASNPLICNMLEGSYRLDATHNSADVTIWRGSNQERYVGGWISRDGGRPTWTDELHSVGLLVMRSTRTGLQIVIEHDGGARPSCP